MTSAPSLNWPLSRRKRAKQLLALDGKQTMIQQTVTRLLPLAPVKQFWIITNEDLRPAIAKQLPNLVKAQLLPEPQVVAYLSITHTQTIAAATVVAYSRSTASAD